MLGSLISGWSKCYKSVDGMGRDVLSSNIRQDKELASYEDLWLQTIVDNKKCMHKLFLHLNE